MSIVQTWHICGSIISDILNLPRIDFQIELLMYPGLKKMYNFIYYNDHAKHSDDSIGNMNVIVPKSRADDALDVYWLAEPHFDGLRTKYNATIKTQKDSFNKNTHFLWIPSIFGYEYPNLRLPQTQLIGPVRSHSFRDGAGDDISNVSNATKRELAKIEHYNIPFLFLNMILLTYIQLLI